MSGTLYVVATPIGNLEDLTSRARQLLAEVDLVAAEDTRHTGRLLMHIGCKTRVMSLHDHNETQAVARIVRALESGGDVALVSDAGTGRVRGLCDVHVDGESGEQCDLHGSSR